MFELVRSIVASGSSVVFISHDIDEVMQITDRITVLRDGEVAGVLETAKATRDEVVEMIVGRRIARSGAARMAPERASVAKVRLENVSGKKLQPCTVELGRGEVLGLTGLIGSGYDEIPYLTFGARPCRSGAIVLETEKETIELSSSKSAARDRPGIRTPAG